MAAARRIPQRVVHQVVEQFGQQQRVAVDFDGGVRPLEPQVGAERQRQRHPVHGLFVGDCVDVGAGQADGAGILGAGQQQQLVDQPGRALGAGHQLAQAGLHFLGAGIAQRQFRLGTQAGQRRLELMRRIGHEAALRLDVGRQAVQQVVHGRYQRRDLGRGGAFVDGREVVGPARPQPLLQRIQGRHAARQAEPHQQHGDRQHHELRNDHALDDVVGQLRALFHGLGHDQQRGLGVGQVQVHPGVSQANAETAQGVVFVLDFARAWLAHGGRQRQGAIATQVFAAAAQRQPEHAVGLVGAQHVARGIGHLQDGAAVLGVDVPRQHMEIVGECPVVRDIGDVLRDHIGNGDAHRPQEEQRRQHPIQDLAQQGTLGRREARALGSGLHDIQGFLIELLWRRRLSLRGTPHPGPVQGSSPDPAR
ncbi:hypothetical protein D3C72_1125040 [compost metagenome]